MVEAAFIFPDQLFYNSPVLDVKDRKIFIIEDPIFFYGVDGNLKLHKKKILLHKAAVNNFYNLLKDRGYDIEIIDHRKCFKKDFYSELIKNNNIEKIVVVEVNALKLENKLIDLTKIFNIKLFFLQTPAFILKKDYVLDLLGEKTHYSLSSFYIKTRKNLNILIENGRPYKGKWSFDTSNRKKLPSGLKIPAIPAFTSNKKHIKIYEKQINIDFSRNYGDLNDFIFPINHSDGLRWFRDFLIYRLKYFGTYQDAISKDSPFLFHSLISPLLNTGLLLPTEVISETLEFSREYKIPINSLEGFIRQIIGWREFVRGIFFFKGEYQKKSNYFGNFRKLNEKFYSGNTSIIPVDNIINKTIKYSYSHHIERLMIMGNFMLLCEIEPEEVYRWFSELFIDAFDWVMIPNVFGMSQYADGGLMSTKPYISSSNYIIHMSDYKKDKWCRIWDSLYWRFLYKKRNLIRNNPRMKLALYNLNKMEKNKIKDHLNLAEIFLGKLF